MISLWQGKKNLIKLIRIGAAAAAAAAALHALFPTSFSGIQLCVYLLVWIFYFSALHFNASIDNPSAPFSDGAQ